MVGSLVGLVVLEDFSERELNDDESYACGVFALSLGLINTLRTNSVAPHVSIFGPKCYDLSRTSRTAKARISSEGFSSSWYSFTRSARSLSAGKAMLKAPHRRVLICEAQFLQRPLVCLSWSSYEDCSSSMEPCKTISGRSSSQQTETNETSERLPEHLARLLDMDCQDVVADSINKRTYDFAWNRRTREDTEVIDICMNIAVNIRHLLVRRCSLDHIPQGDLALLAPWNTA